MMCYYFYVCMIRINKWMEELDRRYRNRVEDIGGATPSKSRKIGPPAASKPPYRFAAV